MTEAIRSANAFSMPTKTFDGDQDNLTGVTRSSSSPYCKVYQIDDYSESKPSAPSNYASIERLVSKWEKNESRRAALEEARRWAVDHLHGYDGETVRTLRLMRGWSQTHLAKKMATSQSHIARIERGTENLAIQTCRKLCAVLDIDMNTLDLALRRQEVISESKTR